MRACRRKSEGSDEPRSITESIDGRTQRLNRMEQQRGTYRRFAAAVLGGLSVNVPMLVMAINPSKVKDLVAASVAVVLFALGLAWKPSAQVKTLLGTAAAFAAVLAGFVGVNGN